MFNRTFTILIGINVFAILFLTVNFLKAPSSNSLRVLKQTQVEVSYSDIFDPKKRSVDPNSPYTFEDPMIAYLLLQKLDIFENAQTNYPKGKDFDKMYYGTKVNNDYCNDHRAFFVYNPDSIFDKKVNFMTDYWNHQFRNTTIPSLGQDLHPKVGREMSKALRTSFFEDINPEANIFFTYTHMNRYRLLGKQFSCLTQASNHLISNVSLDQRSVLGEALVQYSRQYRNRPQCFSSAKLFPETWVLTNTDSCQKFFKYINSPDYAKVKQEKGDIALVRKVGNESYTPGKAVFPVNATEEQELIKLYGNGSKCGKVTKNTIIQAYVPNLLQIDKHPFVFRTFLFVASANPTMAYYHDGYLKISKEDKKTVGNKTVTQMKEEAMFFPEFEGYMLKHKLIDSSQWMEKHFRSQIRKAMIHLVRMIQSKYWKKSSVSEIFGVDFMMDKDLNLWFVKTTSTPTLEGWDHHSDLFFDQMLTDSIEISMGLLRSRTKRIINYINDIIRSPGDWKIDEDSLTLRSLKSINRRKEEFKELTKNHFESEFEPSWTNGWVPIVDENLRDTKRYHENLEEKCL